MSDNIWQCALPWCSDLLTLVQRLFSWKLSKLEDVQSWTLKVPHWCRSLAIGVGAIKLSWRWKEWDDSWRWREWDGSWIHWGWWSWRWSLGTVLIFFLFPPRDRLPRRYADIAVHSLHINAFPTTILRVFCILKFPLSFIERLSLTASMSPLCIFAQNEEKVARLDNGWRRSLARFVVKDNWERSSLLMRAFLLWWWLFIVIILNAYWAGPGQQDGINGGWYGL